MINDLEIVKSEMWKKHIALLTIASIAKMPLLIRDFELTIGEQNTLRLMLILKIAETTSTFTFEQ
jgi:hypothetical protein